MVLLPKKIYFSKDPEGIQHFTGGGGGRGVQMLITIETHITCYFPPPPSGSAHDLNDKR